MATKEIDLQELANAVLESITLGGKYRDEYERGFGDFSGFHVGAVRSNFESQVEDMRDYSEPDQQDWAEFFGEIDEERQVTLIAQPSLATIDDLRIWIGSNEEKASQCDCSGASIFLTSDKSGPVVVIGLMGDNMEPEIFFVSNSSEEAEKTWALDWV